LAAELVAVQQVTGERVLLVPALPRLGRVCRDGVVHVDGVPVGGRDARRSATSPRPADHLVDAGAADVVELAGADAVEAWLTGGASVVSSGTLQTSRRVASKINSRSRSSA